MADNVPRHNQNIVDLAVLLEDVPAGSSNYAKAETDGSTFYKGDREIYMSLAYNTIVSKFVQAYGIKTCATIIPGVIKTQALTFAGTTIALNKDFLFPLNVIKASSTAEYVQTTLENITLNRDFFADTVFTTSGGYLYVEARSSGTYGLLSSGTGLLYYYGAERIDSSTGSVGSPNTTVNGGDITLDSFVLPACVYYAAYRAAMDRSIDERWKQKAPIYLVGCKSSLPAEVAALIG